MPSQDRAATMQTAQRSEEEPGDQDAANVTVGDSPSTNGGSAPQADRRLLIDGQLVTTGRVFASVNPATGQVIGHAPDAGVEEAQAAIAAARRAFDTTAWSTDVQLRIRCLDQLHQALLDHAEELRELTIAEVGATRALTQGAQLDEPIKQLGEHKVTVRLHREVSLEVPVHVVKEAE